MNAKHIPQEIEPKWQSLWAESGLYVTREAPDRNKWYFLTMLPYPSGDLHIGHWYAMTPSDAGARYKRMQGYNVFFPIGFDAFGLPAENAAIKHGTHPYTWTMGNIDKMRGQLRSMGAMWSWEHEAVTCDPEFYKWSQWFFLKLYDHGLAYRKKSPVDFCPKCNTTLAREQVVGDERRCERCDTQVERRLLEQWYFKITAYAEELKRFDNIDWPERIRQAQLNWIGDRSEGAEVVFKSEEGDEIVIFTTRPDTLWGATFMVLAPEHPLVDKLTPASHRENVRAYQFQAGRTTEMERGAAEREKTGVDTGAFAINPVNGKRVPIWIADYVTMSYGTGAIMGVPAHDDRDFAFALKFGLPIIPVIARNDGRAKSAVWEGSVDGDFAAALAAGGFKNERIAIADRGEFYAVELSGEAEAAAYRKLLQAHLKAGHWADIVGMGWQVVFPDAVLTLDSVEADAEIIATRGLRLHAPVPNDNGDVARGRVVSRRPVSPRVRHDGQLGRVHRHAGERGEGEGHRVADRAGHRQVRRAVPPARLADQPPALLGRAHPDAVLRPVRRGAGEVREPARRPTHGCADPAHRREPAEVSRQLPARHLPALRRTGAPRDRHAGHLHVLLVVPVRVCLALLEGGREAQPGRPAVGQGRRRLLAAGRSVHRRT